MLDPLSRRLLRGAGNRAPIALMYHSIAPGGGTPAWRWAVSRRRFVEQLDLLRKHGWSTRPVRDLAAGLALPPRTALITFDDGFADNLAAVEELSRRGMSATWFVVTRDLGGESRWGDVQVSGRPMLSVARLREMAAAGMEIGAHTRTHARLPETDPSRLDDEIGGSRNDLEQALGSPVRSFAYPYGLYNDPVVDAVRRAGYRVACTTRSGWGLVGNDLLRVRRVAVFAADTLSGFARKLAFADNEVDWPKVGRYYLDRLTTRLAA
jgi:peptidoglycan/xylan/chitin deacetylase (PgdA/CDA1 family)